jgi:hypothetical protein
MLQTIQVEIDATGHIHLMEPLSFKPVGRALLTLLDTTIESTLLQAQTNDERGSVDACAKVIIFFTLCSQTCCQYKRGCAAH